MPQTFALKLSVLKVANLAEEEDGLPEPSMRFRPSCMSR